MKSSEFERLVDYSKKNNVNSVISTDKSFMSTRKKHCHSRIVLDDFIIQFFLKIRNYSEKVDGNNKNFMYYSNGKSILEINPMFNCICNGYRFDEYFENKDIKSKGSFPSNGSGMSPYIDREYYKRSDYNGSEYFKQAFLYEDKLAVVSLKLKKVDEISGWCCYYPKFSMFMEISYFDINNNDSLKGLNNDAKLDIISCTNSFLAKTAVADKTEFINIKDNLVGEIIHSDSTFFCDLGEKDSHLMCESLSKSFDKVEKYLGVSLELQEKNSILKRLFFK